MANYNVLKTAIQNAVDWDNNDKQISGNDMLAILLSIVNNTVSAGYLFAGVATTETDPGTPDQRVFYIAGPGTYPNFNGVVVNNGYIGVFIYSTSWTTTLFRTTFGYAFGGVANLNTTPSLTVNAFYFPVEIGTYENFDNLTALQGEICIFWRGQSGNWQKELIKNTDVVNGFINVSSITGGATTTFQNAVNSIPTSIRAAAKGIVFRDSENLGRVTVAVFADGAIFSNWSNLSYWKKLVLEDTMNNKCGLFQYQLTEQSAPSGNVLYEFVPGAFNKMRVIKNSSDSNGRWRILVTYTDNTREFFNISTGDITDIVPTKAVSGFQLVLMSTTATCYIDCLIFINDALTLYELLDNRISEQIDALSPETIGAVKIFQGIGNAGKTLVVDSSGNVVPGSATPSIIDGDAERKVLTKKLYLGQNIASLVSLGSGWSGNINTGFTHTTGTDPLILNATESGAAYLITINASSVAESSYFVSIGDGYLVDAYTGQSQQRIGFISDGGNVKITPDSSYSGTITVKVQKIVPEESATEIVDVEMANVDANNMGDTITSFWNVSIGPGPGTLGKSVNSSRNIGIGLNALRELISGTRNIAIGTFAAVALKNAKGNVAIGADAMFLKQYGDDNVSIGRASMGSNAQTVNNNICIGVSSGASASGDDNVCIGRNAGYRATSGSVYVGMNAGFNFTGANNIAIGRNAGYVGGTIAGNWNICIGSSSSFGNNVSFSTAIGYQARATKSNQLVLGGDNITESLLHGDVVVRGTDSILRKIIFNQDGTVQWETVQ